MCSLLNVVRLVLYSLLVTKFQESRSRLLFTDRQISVSQILLWWDFAWSVLVPASAFCWTARAFASAFRCGAIASSAFWTPVDRLILLRRALASSNELALAPITQMDRNDVCLPISLLIFTDTQLTYADIPTALLSLILLRRAFASSNKSSEAYHLWLAVWKSAAAA